MNIKQAYLILASVVVAGIALLYGVSPRWFASSFLGVADLDRNVAHILRAIMGLYLGVIYTVAELALVPIGYWVYRLPESRQSPE